MAGGEQGGKLGIARDHGSEDAGVLLPVLAGAGAAVDREGDRRALAQAAHHVGQHRIAARFGQPLVEFGVEAGELLGGPALAAWLPRQRS